MSRTWSCQLCGAPHWESENPIEITLNDLETEGCSNCIDEFISVFNETISRLERNKAERERDE